MNTGNFNKNDEDGDSDYDDEHLSNDLVLSDKCTSHDCSEVKVRQEFHYPDDGGEETCPICLNEFEEQQIGLPVTCKHVFCVDCILEWSKNANSCPVDRIEFSSIKVYKRFGGCFLHDLTVDLKICGADATYAETTYCEICRSGENEETLLLCDGCDMGYHCECLQPPLTNIPSGEWFCENCRISHVNTTSNRTSRVVGRTLTSERVRRRIADTRLRHSTTSSSLDEQLEAIVTDILRDAGQRLQVSAARKCVGNSHKPVKKRRKHKRKKGIKKSGFVSKKRSSCYIKTGNRGYQQQELPNIGNTFLHSFSLTGDSMQFDEYASRNMETNDDPNYLIARKHALLSQSAMRFNTPLPALLTYGSTTNTRDLVEPPAPEPDILSNIFSAQELLLAPCRNVIIQRGGGLKLNKKKNPSNPFLFTPKTTQINEKSRPKIPEKVSGIVQLALSPTSKSQEDMRLVGTSVSTSNTSNSALNQSNQSYTGTIACPSRSNNASEEDSSKNEDTFIRLLCSTSTDPNEENDRPLRKLDKRRKSSFNLTKPKGIVIKPVLNLPSSSVSVCVSKQMKSDDGKETYDPFKPTEDDRVGSDIYDPFDPTLSDEERDSPSPLIVDHSNETHTMNIDNQDKIENKTFIANDQVQITSETNIMNSFSPVSSIELDIEEMLDNQLDAANNSVVKHQGKETSKFNTFSINKSITNRSMDIFAEEEVLAKSNSTTTQTTNLSVIDISGETFTEEVCKAAIKPSIAPIKIKNLSKTISFSFSSVYNEAEGTSLIKKQSTVNDMHSDVKRSYAVNDDNARKIIDNETITLKRDESNIKKKDKKLADNPILYATKGCLPKSDSFNISTVITDVGDIQSKNKTARIVDVDQHSSDIVVAKRSHLSEKEKSVGREKQKSHSKSPHRLAISDNDHKSSRKNQSYNRSLQHSSRRSRSRSQHRQKTKKQKRHRSRSRSTSRSHPKKSYTDKKKNNRRSRSRSCSGSGNTYKIRSRNKSSDERKRFDSNNKAQTKLLFHCESISKCDSDDQPNSPALVNANAQERGEVGDVVMYKSKKRKKLQAEELAEMDCRHTKTIDKSQHSCSHNTVTDERDKKAISQKSETSFKDSCPIKNNHGKKKRTCYKNSSDSCQNDEEVETKSKNEYCALSSPKAESDNQKSVLCNKELSLLFENSERKEQIKCKASEKEQRLYSSKCGEKSEMYMKKQNIKKNHDSEENDSFNQTISECIDSTVSCHDGLLTEHTGTTSESFLIGDTANSDKMQTKEVCVSEIATCNITETCEMDIDELLEEPFNNTGSGVMSQKQIKKNEACNDMADKSGIMAKENLDCMIVEEKTRVSQEVFVPSVLIQAENEPTEKKINQSCNLSSEPNSRRLVANTPPFSMLTLDQEFQATPSYAEKFLEQSRKRWEKNLRNKSPHISSSCMSHNNVLQESPAKFKKETERISECVQDDLAETQNMSLVHDTGISNKSSLILLTTETTSHRTQHAKDDALDSDSSTSTSMNIDMPKSGESNALPKMNLSNKVIVELSHIACEDAASLDSKRSERDTCESVNKHLSDNTPCWSLPASNSKKKKSFESSVPKKRKRSKSPHSIRKKSYSRKTSRSPYRKNHLNNSPQRRTKTRSKSRDRKKAQVLKRDHKISHHGHRSRSSERRNYSKYQTTHTPSLSSKTTSHSLEKQMTSFFTESAVAQSQAVSIVSEKGVAQLQKQFSPQPITTISGISASSSYSQNENQVADDHHDLSSLTLCSLVNDANPALIQILTVDNHSIEKTTKTIIASPPPSTETDHIKVDDSVKALVPEPHSLSQPVLDPPPPPPPPKVTDRGVDSSNPLNARIVTKFLGFERESQGSVSKTAKELENVLNPTQILNIVGLNPQNQSAAEDAIMSIAELSKQLQLGQILNNNENETSVPKEEQSMEAIELSSVTIDDIESSAVAMYNKDVSKTMNKKKEFQKNVVTAAKAAIKPYYEQRQVSKAQYKDIMKRAVNKICQTDRTMEVNIVKIQRLIRRYVECYQQKRSKRIMTTNQAELLRTPPSPVGSPLIATTLSTKHNFNTASNEGTPSLLKKEPRKIVTLPDLPLPPPPPPPKPPNFRIQGL